MMRRLLFVFTAAALASLLGACGETAQIPTGGGTTSTTSNTGDGGDGGGTTQPSGGSGGGSSGSTTSAGGGDGGGGSPPLAKCEGKDGNVGDWNMKIMAGGIERSVDVHIPGKYDHAVPTTLVLNFHGYNSNALQEALLSEMSAASDERGFIVVYPQGVGNSWNADKCCGTAASTDLDDVGFVSTLVDEMLEEYCIDPKQVFATGMSNGGFLSHRLACELSDKIAAIAPVAGVMGIPFESCQPGRKVPVLQFHGTADLVVPYDGSTIFGFPSVADTMALWQQIDGCGAALEVTYENGDSQCVSTQGCADGTEVILCTIDGGGHTWPGGTPIPGLGKTTMDLDATKAMLDFFEKHPMP